MKRRNFFKVLPAVVIAPLAIAGIKSDKVLKFKPGSKVHFGPEKKYKMRGIKPFIKYKVSSWHEIEKMGVNVKHDKHGLHYIEHPLFGSVYLKDL